MFCSNCGTENSDGAVFCKSCGASLTEEQTPDTQATTFAPRYPDIYESYKPIGMWGYLGYEILFSIPVIGMIFLLVFSLGGTKNVNLKNFARSYFCITIIYLVVIIAVLSSMIGPALSYIM